MVQRVEKPSFEMPSIPKAKSVPDSQQAVGSFTKSFKSRLLGLLGALAIPLNPQATANQFPNQSEPQAKFQIASSETPESISKNLPQVTISEHQLPIDFVTQLGVSKESYEEIASQLLDFVKNNYPGFTMQYNAAQTPEQKSEVVILFINTVWEYFESINKKAHPSAKNPGPADKAVYLSQYLISQGSLLQCIVPTPARPQAELIFTQISPAGSATIKEGNTEIAIPIMELEQFSKGGLLAFYDENMKAIFIAKNNAAPILEKYFRYLDRLGIKYSDTEVQNAVAAKRQSSSAHESQHALFHTKNPNLKSQIELDEMGATAMGIANSPSPKMELVGLFYHLDLPSEYSKAANFYLTALGQSPSAPQHLKLAIQNYFQNRALGLDDVVKSLHQSDVSDNLLKRLAADMYHFSQEAVEDAVKNQKP